LVRSIQNGSDRIHGQKYLKIVGGDAKTKDNCVFYLKMGSIIDSASDLPSFQKVLERLLKRFAAHLSSTLAGIEQDCLLCASPAKKRILCEACEGELPYLNAALCPRCALPSPDGRLCGRCLTKPPHFDATRAVFRYEFPVDKLVQAFKYGHKFTLGGYFGQRMAAAPFFGGEGAVPRIDTLIPLPLHPERLRERGFNQSLELAKTVASAWSLPVDSAHCKRIRNTPAQADLPWKERRRNIRNAFCCSNDFAGKRVLIIDDVMTTGASISELAHELKRGGAAWVGALVLARVPPK
jgi:ComF family protein